MGARGKKRKRADGSIASGKSGDILKPMQVPEVEPEHLREGLRIFREEIMARGNPANDDPRWEIAYQAAQARLHPVHGKWPADAILWRATLLEGLIRFPPFRDAHLDGSNDPTDTMLFVAAQIPTSGADTAFDIDAFELMLGLIDRPGNLPHPDELAPLKSV